MSGQEVIEGGPVPPPLAAAIREGRCVAFVGAGFTRPLLPGWRELLINLGRELGVETFAPLLAGDELRHRDHEAIAQFLQARAGSPVVFEGALARALDPERREGLRSEELAAHRATFDTRVRTLRAIPFHSILTTNFDALFEGKTPSPEVFAEVIRSERRPWWSWRAWSERYGGPGDVPDWQAPLVKLHGDLRAEEGRRKLAFTTRDYRRLLHEEPGYRAFLRTLFATHSVLYLGFSFTDGYINDLRAEILSWVGQSRPRDFAIMENVRPELAEHLSEHESLECLSFRAEGEDFSGFDRWLEAIYEETAPEAALRARVAGRRILWFDPQLDNNRFGHHALGAGEATRLELRKHLDDVISDLSDGAPPVDLVISHYGYLGPDDSNLRRLVARMRALPSELQAPVLVFSEPSFRHENRPKALRLGAFDYVDSWPELFAAIERIFSR